MKKATKTSAQREGTAAIHTQNNDDDNSNEN